MTEYSTAESRYQSPSAGYRGGINPVFVSLSERENVAIRSKIPTPPPRNYFPVRPSELDRTTEREYSQVTERIFSNDNYVYNGFYKDKIDEITSAGYPPDSTTQLYSPPYEVTRPSQDQWSYWQTTTPAPATAPPYFDNSDIWPEYNKVVNNLLQDKGNDYQGKNSHNLTLPEIITNFLTTLAL